MMWMGLEVGLGVDSLEETGQGCMYCRKWVRVDMEVVQQERRLSDG